MKKKFIWQCLTNYRYNMFFAASDYDEAIKLVKNFSIEARNATGGDISFDISSLLLYASSYVPIEFFELENAAIVKHTSYDTGLAPVFIEGTIKGWHIDNEREIVKELTYGGYGHTVLYKPEYTGKFEDLPNVDCYPVGMRFCLKKDAALSGILVDKNEKFSLYFPEINSIVKMTNTEFFHYFFEFFTITQRHREDGTIMRNEMISEEISSKMKTAFAMDFKNFMVVLPDILEDRQKEASAPGVL